MIPWTIFLPIYCYYQAVGFYKYPHFSNKILIYQLSSPSRIFCKWRKEVQIILSAIFTLPMKSIVPIKVLSCQLGPIYPQPDWGNTFALTLMSEYTLPHPDWRNTYFLTLIGEITPMSLLWLSEHRLSQPEWWKHIPCSHSRKYLFPHPDWRNTFTLTLIGGTHFPSHLIGKTHFPSHWLVVQTFPHSDWRDTFTFSLNLVTHFSSLWLAEHIYYHPDCRNTYRYSLTLIGRKHIPMLWLAKNIFSNPDWWKHIPDSNWRNTHPLTLIAGIYVYPFILIGGTHIPHSDWRKIYSLP